MTLPACSRSWYVDDSFARHGISADPMGDSASGIMLRTRWSAYRSVQGAIRYEPTSVEPSPRLLPSTMPELFPSESHEIDVVRLSSDGAFGRAPLR